MRRSVGLAIVLALGAAGAAAAEATTSEGDAAQLMGAAFAPVSPEDFSNLAQRESLRPDGGIAQLRSGQVVLGKRAGRVDTLRVTVGGALRSPGAGALALDRAELEADAYEVALTREWTGLRFDAGKYDLDVTPHAGLGVGNAGGSAEAGATVVLGKKSKDDQVVARLNEIGVRDGAQFGDKGRWYLFAAASGRAVGMNMLRQDGGWNRAGWSTDPASALVGDAHVGVGWRKGPMQTSFGYIHREVKGDHLLFGQETKDDEVVALSLSIKPRR